MLSRRSSCAAFAAGPLSACLPAAPAEVTKSVPPPPDRPALPPRYGAITTEPFPVPAVPEGLVPPHLWRQQVANPFTAAAPGTFIVNPLAGFLYLVESP